MSGTKKKRKDASTNCSDEEQKAPGHLHECAVVGAEKQVKHRDEAEHITEGNSVETGPDKVEMTGQSLVYTATKDTLFGQKTTQNHVLSPEWVLGRESSIPVFCLQDHDKLIVLYAGAHVGIIYNHTSNAQHLLQGHSHQISCICVSEDRRWIATADCGSQSMLIVWDSYSGIPVQTLFDCHVGGGVIAMAFSSNAKDLVTLGGEKVQRVCIWDWTSEVRKPFLWTELSPEHGFQDYISFKPTDRTQLLSGSKSHVLFYSWAKGNLQYFAMKPKRSILAEVQKALTQPSPGLLQNADVLFCKSVFHWENPQILTPILGSIMVWDVMDDLVENQYLPVEKILLIIQLMKHPISVLTVTDGCFVTGSTEGEIHFFDETFTYLTEIDDLNLDAVTSISFSKECAEEYLEDCFLKAKPFIRNFVVSTASLKVVHVNAQNNIQTPLLQHNPLQVVACHPSQPAVAMGSQDGFLKVWDYKNKVIIGSRAFDTDRDIQCVTFDPKGLYLAVGFGSGSVRILDSHTLQSDQEESLRSTTKCIHLITFSADSQYLATADSGKGVTVFHLQRNEGPLLRWMYLGRYCSHYKPIVDLLFGVSPGSTQPRLLSLGMDRQLVEYDLKKSVTNQLLILSSERIEQSATPRCMAWYPPLSREHFLLIASDQYKMKLFNSTTNMCRKTLLGPTYGSPIKQVAVLPKSKEAKINAYHLAYINEDKVGLQILPLDGNPYNSSAVICHPAGVSALSCSYDGRFVFTVGASDCCVFSWEINLNVLEAAAALGGKDMFPFYSFLEGGRDGKFYRDMEDFFYYCQIQVYGPDLIKKGRVPNEIPLSEVPSLMRAVGHFPTEKEIEDMHNEIKFSKYAETGKHVTDINLEDFIKLYVNHRPAFGISIDEIYQAFCISGRTDSTGQPVLLKHELLDSLQLQGERMTEEELKQCFATLLSLNEDEEKEETLWGASGGAECSVESVFQRLPEEISAETFIHSILGSTSSVEQSGRPSSPN
ncbi:cilia- and flagella-associated protein 251 [Cololabis saira]|uniref:cilia- and flagella-associated protein 251 n=1 Tax=Cololabis saira TaxID=129043 RepID=UPI002AD38076|nr:cilia- and flagella-associated protein 251 [Cololabis saira]